MLYLYPLLVPLRLLARLKLVWVVDSSGRPSEHVSSVTIPLGMQYPVLLPLTRPFGSWCNDAGGASYLHNYARGNSIAYT